ncbi:hypothetical protein I3271_09355 [Photobacterium leiognathi]|uniref:hypothetical protein n=1 Tax=Photobacterium leiognathi TaxID=553611 RepID=UPI001EDD6C98|nr:hypothetical protein [Photobacterium leiognathi]MCG3884894.1 hypothetical protein [Photobacterium leiognathi]
MMVNEMSLLDNPFVYIDPNASAANCGLGFELPGLPKIGGTGGLNIDLCQAVKSVAGDTMEKLISKWQIGVIRQLTRLPMQQTKL